MLGNKGAAAISFNYLNYTFLMLSCHLAAGQNDVNERNKHFERINRELSIKDITPSSKNHVSISDKFDICILLGDLNYRLDISLDLVPDKLASCSLKELMIYDQLTNMVSQGLLDLNCYKEGPIYFYPTYKYVPQTSNYDLESKQPGWTDRILYKTAIENQFKLKSYKSVKEVMCSDHKPVVADFLFTFPQPFLDIKSSINFNQKDDKSKACSIY